MNLSKVRKIILDILFPINCLNCQREGSWLCDSCFNLIPINNKLTCPVCHINSNGVVCQTCQNKTQINGLIKLTTYHHPINERLFHTFKYLYIEDIANIFNKIFSKFLLKFDNKKIIPILNSSTNLIITSVPLHKKRYLDRNFNQSDLLAKKFAKELRLPYYPNLITRVKNTPPQAQLNRANRLKNLNNAFKLTKPIDLSNKNVIIVDDIATTLATLDECAKALKKTNCVEIWGLVIARGK